MATGTAVTEQTRLGSAAATNGAGPQDVPEIVTFPDLVRAHRAWEVELYGCSRESREPDRTLEHEFRRKWGQFETRYGQIKNAYWSVRDASAVAFSVKKRRRAVRVWDHEHIPRFHRVTDWATRDEPEVARALDDCESLAVRVEEILRGPSELIALAPHQRRGKSAAGIRRPGVGSSGTARGDRASERRTGSTRRSARSS